MPVIQKLVQIGAGATTSNILSGDEFEFIPYNARVDFGFNQSATGLVLDVHSGNDLLGKSFEPYILANYPDNERMDFSDLIGAGERVTVSARNTTGGALDLYYRLVITPL